MKTKTKKQKKKNKKHTITAEDVLRYKMLSTVAISKRQQLYDLQANARKAQFPISFRAISRPFRRCCRGLQSAGGLEMTDNV